MIENVYLFINNFYIIEDVNYFYLSILAEKIQQDDDYKNLITKFIKIADLQIEDLSSKKEEVNDKLAILTQPWKWKIFTQHKKYDEDGNNIGFVDFELDKYESDGTKQFLSLIGPIIEVLTKGGILIVDEIEDSLHTLLVENFIKLFNNINNKKAQIIFTTHNTKLLSRRIFRRDQIWFTEKNLQGATYINSLYDFSVRKDASFEKDYLLGKYGAIPYLEDISESFYGNG
jgi:AAA15 family ATPase/GTPase